MTSNCLCVVVPGNSAVFAVGCSLALVFGWGNSALDSVVVVAHSNFVPGGSVEMFALDSFVEPAVHNFVVLSVGKIAVVGHSSFVEVAVPGSSVEVPAHCTLHYIDDLQVAHSNQTVVIVGRLGLVAVAGTVADLT